MTMKTLAFAAPNTMVSKLSADLRKSGYTVIRNSSAGTMSATVTGGTEVVVRALRMKPNAWIIRADDSVVNPA